MPRAKFTKPPGSPRQIRRAKFRFSGDQRRKLAGLLPPKLAASSLQGNAASHPKTVADHIVQETEKVIIAYLTAEPTISEVRINPANVRAAIRQMRQALKMWEWVDDETYDIFPHDPDVDAKLAAREQELAQLRVAPARQRALRMLCQDIRLAMGLASAKGEKVGDQEVLRYIDAALNFAGIRHARYRKRLAAVVFPKN